MKERMFLLYGLIDENDYNERISKIKKEIGTDYIINIDPFYPNSSCNPFVVIMATKKQWKRIKSLLSLDKIYY